MEFDPYREWLGLSGGRPHAFDLLGISPRESDAEAIRKAGAQRIAQLEELDPGPHAAVRERLLREIKQATQALADPQRREAYLAKLRASRGPQRSDETSSSPPTLASSLTVATFADTVVAVPRPASNDALDPFDPMAPLAPAAPSPPSKPAPSAGMVSSAAPFGSPASASGGGSEVLQRYLEARRKSRRQWSIIGGVLVVVIAIGSWFAYSRRDQLLSWLKPETEVAQETKDAPTESTSADNPSTDAEKEDPPVSSESPEEEPSTEETSPEETDSDDSSMTDGETPDDTMVDGDPAMEPPTDPETPPDPTDPDEPTEPTEGDESDSPQTLNLPQSYALAQTLRAVLTGLTTPEETGVDEALQRAQEISAGTEDAPLVDRLRLVVETNRRFWEVVAECCGSLESSQELAFDASTVVVVVEASSERIVYRVNGQRQERAPRALPPGLARFIVETIRPNDEENPLLIGALYAAESAKDSSRRETAEALWREVESESDELNSLLDWLQDDYKALVSRHKPIAPPEADALAAAQEEVKTLWTEKMEAAKRPDQRSELADEILEAATQLEPTPQAYAHFLLALDQLGASGKSRRLEPALVVFSSWFQIDPITLSADVFEKTTRVPGDPEDHKYTVETSLALAESAIGKQRGEEAERLLDIATDAAQRSKDNEVKAATLQKVRMLKQRLASQ